MINSLLANLITIYCLISIIIAIYQSVHNVYDEEIEIKVLVGVIIFIISILFWPILAFQYFKNQQFPNNDFEELGLRLSNIPPGYLPGDLIKRISIQEAENRNIRPYFINGTFPMPFGSLNPLWIDIKAKMIEGDEVWTFSSSARHWESLCGRAGICIVRNGNVVDGILLLYN